MSTPRIADFPVASELDGRDIAAHDPGFAVAYMREMATLLPQLTEDNPVLLARAKALLDRYQTIRPLR